jgi:outer membrane protein OmpA-like peptidoglycan-associated protein
MNPKFTSLTLVILSALAVSAGAEEVVPAEKMSGWKLTKSLNQPAVVETLRKGLGVETGSAAAGSEAAPVEIEVKVDAGSAFAFQNIRFALNSAELTGETTFRQLAEVAKAMERATGESFLIEGHTCDLGAEPTNLDLSYRRALAVRAVLAGLGVAGERLHALGVGERNRLVEETTEDARTRNRRVEIYRKL